MKEKVVSLLFSALPLAIIFHWAFYLYRSPYWLLAGISFFYIFGTIIPVRINARMLWLIYFLVLISIPSAYHIKTFSNHLTVALFAGSFVLGLLSKVPREKKLFEAVLCVLVAILFSIVISIPEIIFLLASLNFLVHIYLHYKVQLVLVLFPIALLAVNIYYFSFPSPNFSRQSYYNDLLINEKELREGVHLGITKWKGNHFVFQNGRKYVTDYDYKMYYESMAVPAILLKPNAKSVLIVGNETRGLFPVLDDNLSEARIEHLAVDNRLYAFFKKEFVLVADQKTKLQNHWLIVGQAMSKYDIIILDLPFDLENDLDLTKWAAHLNTSGLLVYPFDKQMANETVVENLGFAEFSSVVTCNNIITLGESCWQIVSNNAALIDATKLTSTSVDLKNTSWFNRAALDLMVDLKSVQNNR